MRRITIGFFAALVLIVAACDAEDGMSAEQRELRIAAYRVACAARAVQAEAAQNEAMLEATIASADPSTASGEATIRTTNAVLDFSRAYSQHADLRASVYAYMDSAANHSASPADSARYSQRAAAFATRTPPEGTIEANVVQSYDRNIGALLANGDHPCNWELPF